ncbi:GNAT acetyltransferase 2-domain-containing protein [Cantharellus anzutake]|uniref:GNAT acetyltransferase 2-domain-containing protein n=1 Tax=Cantharellus anzutake TaxID=1750568 RepID=UPI001902E2F9|nr:GNAT acetyltransferase 2-domain-containing protein [Cantharellus anzutake]KAF8340689.1 GNAT acetyltransferase 2-domain-containing protein [Cantharellus anzutake]
MRKQLDPRLPILINNGIKKNHRSFIALVGDRGREQVCSVEPLLRSCKLTFLVITSRVSSRPSVLWCYKKDLGFTSHRKIREKSIRQQEKRGLREQNEKSPFELFVTVTDIRYTYYKESHKILGNTFGMCVLQDFEAVTPNLLARTIETVEGGGLVILLLKTMTSLKQLYTMTMDVHARYRTAAHDSVVARFNERFILSLGACEDCLVLDDELNVLPISRGKDIRPVEDRDTEDLTSKPEKELKELKSSLSETKPVGDLIQLARTLDQAKALLTFIDAIAEKTLSSTVTLTASRGRGKSAALGLAIAAALAHGYANIFVTSPSPENLKTLFEFIFKGMDALGYEEHLDYDIAQSTNPDFNKAIVRVNLFRNHRQTIQYIQPEDAHVLGQAELVIIDEAAAIPLPLVKNLIGPYLVFMSSTINGYEGTGRSLSLKLIQQLRESTRPSLTKDSADLNENVASTSSKRAASSSTTMLKARTLREIQLEEPIRYSSGDKVEKWLHAVLCLDATVVSKMSFGTPHPSACELYYVNRDTLFSYHPASEVFLQRLMALYVASHYKNSPNDLQLMSDAPAHHLFVLLPPLKDDESVLPDPLVVLQVALEGNISKDIIMESLSKGERSSGDLLPWIMSQQYQDSNFAKLSGARIVRIATHPDYTSMGYGAQAVKVLGSYYSGEIMNVEESVQDENYQTFEQAAEVKQNASLLEDELTHRSASSLPPLLHRLSHRKPEILDYLGVSYGLTRPLLKFWKRVGFAPYYLRQTENDITGEYAAVMLKALSGDLGLEAFAQDFRRRFLSLLSFRFREFEPVTALSIIEAVNNVDGHRMMDPVVNLKVSELNMLLTPFDLKRLESYSNNMLDYHVILDLLPTIATLYFDKRLGDLKLHAVQSGILLALGLQRKSIEDVEALALFVKLIRRVLKHLIELQRSTVEDTVPAQADSRPVLEDAASQVRDELKEAGKEFMKEMKEKAEKTRIMLGDLDLSKYAIDDTNRDWTRAEAQVNALAHNTQNEGTSTVISVMGNAPTPLKRKTEEDESGGNKKFNRGSMRTNGRSPKKSFKKRKR